MKIKKQVGTILSNEKGFVLPVGLMFLAIIAILGSTAVIVTITDLKIGTNYRLSKQAFYAAEAGIEEARARLRGGAAGFINDGYPEDTLWRAYIGVDLKAQGKGWDSSSAMHVKVNSLQSDLDYSDLDYSDLDYIVKIIHQTNAAGDILYWGDPDGDGISERNAAIFSGNKNIYLVTSYGYSDSSSKVIEVEMTKIPPITAPAALYVEVSTKIQGASTHILGMDSCGADNKPGIATTKPIIDPDDGKETVTTSGNPIITGTAGTNPDVLYNGTNMDVQSVVDSFKGEADFTYIVDSDTHTGMDWGTPTPGATLQDPSSCSESNIVYYDTQDTDIKLSGGTSGCGILLVDGDLRMDGGFSWHGIVIATGSVIFLGGGDKNITGALISGRSVDADIIGGNSNVIYCSSAVENQTENRPLRILSWQEKM